MENQRQVSLAEANALYGAMAAKLDEARRRFGRPLTLAEKILCAHLFQWNNGETHPIRGVTHARLSPDRIAMQDATAQMALLQFMLAGMQKVKVPTTVHCDHLILARKGARQDLLTARTTNSQVYDFLLQSSRKYGAGFWEPGSGIIHQVVLENYAYPGALMIGTDSHTPNAGGLGMLAIGVGGADAVFTMAGEPWSVKWPKLIGVRLTGSLSGWAAPKDIILKLAGILSVKGGTGAIVEYFGPGAATISATGKATITNMGAELGATTSVFPTDEHTLAYLRLTGRAGIADAAETVMPDLRADREVEEDPESYFDQVIEIDLDTLEPHIVGPHTPDLARPISQFAKAVAEEGYPADLRYALIGSCTNSSYEDMSRAAAVARQAVDNGIEAAIKLLVTPGSQQVFQTIERDGQLEALNALGATVLANACGPCIGQWQRSDIETGETNSIITSFNRNFPRRNDGNPSTLAFIASPEIVTAFALSGSLSFNPLTDTLPTAGGDRVKLDAPPQAGLPEHGFANVTTGFVEPDQDGNEVEVTIEEDSERLELLAPFAAWDGEDLMEMPVLLKAAGKCTTDHISPAGPWLRFRGHLDRISDNMFAGANNAFTEEPGTGISALTGETGNLAKIARAYKASGLSWVAIGDENYGEGSSREHAAMSPRHLGCRVVIARSFARIHETNLKQQGILALTFADSGDYDNISDGCTLSIANLDSLAPGKPVKVRVGNGTASDEIVCNHSMTAEQIEWFKAGSALNFIKQRGTHMETNTPSFAAGLEGVTALATRLSRVDGTNGRLIFCGHDAPELAANHSVEAVWFLLHEGRLPDADELDEFKAKVESYGQLSSEEVKLVRQCRTGEPLSDFRSAISAIASARGYKPWLNRDLAEVEEEIMGLCALAPAIVEVLRTGRKPLLKRGNRGYADRYLWGVLRRKPSIEAVQAVSTYLVLTMDHGSNASTFAGRVTASTGADVGAALTTAVGTLSGPLHGGAPGPVLDMLDSIGEPDQAQTWVKGELAAKRRIMGFGHRVYRTDDPRSRALREVAGNQNGPRIGLATVVEQEVLAALAAHQEAKVAASGQPARPLRTNVEFWTAVVLEHVGIPRELFSSTFATSRIIGWGEHIREQISDNKLFRPLSAYVGPDVQ